MAGPASGCTSSAACADGASGSGAPPSGSPPAVAPRPSVEPRAELRAAPRAAAVPVPERPASPRRSAAQRHPRGPSRGQRPRCQAAARRLRRARKRPLARQRSGLAPAPAKASAKAGHPAQQAAVPRSPAQRAVPAAAGLPPPPGAPRTRVVVFRLAAARRDGALGRPHRIPLSLVGLLGWAVFVRIGESVLVPLEHGASRPWSCPPWTARRPGLAALLNTCLIRPQRCHPPHPPRRRVPVPATTPTCTSAAASALEEAASAAGASTVSAAATALR